MYLLIDTEQLWSINMCHMSRVLRGKTSCFWNGLGKASWCWCPRRSLTQLFRYPRACTRCSGNIGKWVRHCPVLVQSEVNCCGQTCNYNKIEGGYNGHVGCHGKTEPGDPNCSREHRRKVLQRGCLSHDLKDAPAPRTVKACRCEVRYQNVWGSDGLSFQLAWADGSVSGRSEGPGAWPPRLTSWPYHLLTSCPGTTISLCLSFPIWK